MFFSRTPTSSGMSAEEARNATEALEALDPVPMDRALLLEAWRLEDRHSLSFWDAMIVAAAELSDCATQYPEAMVHDAVYGSVRVVNPFSQAGPDLHR